jgi:hypothetical protein
MARARSVRDCSVQAGDGVRVGGDGRDDGAVEAVRGLRRVEAAVRVRVWRALAEAVLHLVKRARARLRVARVRRRSGHDRGRTGRRRAHAERAVRDPVEERDARVREVAELGDKVAVEGLLEEALEAGLGAAGLREAERVGERARLAEVGAEEKRVTELLGRAGVERGDAVDALGEEHGRAAAVPTLAGDLLGLVENLARVGRVEVHAEERRNGRFVGNTARADRAVGEEARDEVSRADGKSWKTSSAHAHE